MRAVFLLAAVCGAAVSAAAQVSVSLSLEREHVLPGELLRGAVRLTNFSGQTLRLGQDDNWLRFTFETAEGRLVTRRGTVPVQGEFELATSKVATKRVELSPYFDLSSPGRYLVVATVRIEDWGQEIHSKPVTLDVSRGSVMWQQDIGVPMAGSDKGAPEVRRYALLRVPHTKGTSLYARVSDPSGERVFAVFPLGPVLSFSDPQQQIDRESRLHVLCQTGARSFVYSVIDPNGRLVVRQTHDYSNTRPTLKKDDQGKIYVGGGARRPAADDIPASTPTAPEPEPKETQNPP